MSFLESEEGCVRKIYQKDAESDRKEKQGLKIFYNGHVQEKAAYRPHDDVFPADGREKRGKTGSLHCTDE